jgi:hypothetical protein
MEPSLILEPQFRIGSHTCQARHHHPARPVLYTPVLQNQARPRGQIPGGAPLPPSGARQTGATRPDLTGLGRPLVEFSHRPLTMMRPTAGSGVAARCGSVPPGVLLRGALSISSGQHDLELIELIPLGIGPLPLRNRQKRLQASARGNRLRFIHGGIISSFDPVQQIPFGSKSY